MKFQFTIKASLFATLILFASGKLGAQSTVVINEVMASNTTTVADQDGEFDDWIELYNNSNSTVDLSDWYLSDNPDNLDKWGFPAGTSIASKDYIIVWADEDSSQVGFHANFKLSAAGEQLLLINASGTAVQDISFGAQQADKGYARSPNGTGSFTIKDPTFKANNDTGVSAVDELEQAKLLTIFPNPAGSGEVVLRSEKPGQQSVEVYDQLGRKVFSTFFSKQTSIGIDQWPSGMYTVKTGSSRQLLVIQ